MNVFYLQEPNAQVLCRKDFSTSEAVVLGVQVAAVDQLERGGAFVGEKCNFRCSVVSARRTDAEVSIVVDAGRHCKGN